MSRCQIEECDNKMIARGMCHKHYKRWQIHGDVHFTLKKRERACEISGCSNKHYAKGLCGAHRLMKSRYGRTNRVIFNHNSMIDAYEAKVIKNGDKCWGWSGSINNKGYATVSHNKKNEFIHRFSYRYYYGDFDPHLLVCHKCDNPICSNPDHLFLGTQKDNMQDCIKKRRFKKVLNEFKAKGSSVSSAKLNEQQVLEIKKLILVGKTNYELSKIYGTTHKNISAIRNNRTWKHIKI